MCYRIPYRISTNSQSTHNKQGVIPRPIPPSPIDTSHSRWAMSAFACTARNPSRPWTTDHVPAHFLFLFKDYFWYSDSDCGEYTGMALSSTHWSLHDINLCYRLPTLTSLPDSAFNSWQFSSSRFVFHSNYTFPIFLGGSMHPLHSLFAYN